MEARVKSRKTKSNGEPLNICLLTYRGNPSCGGQGIYIKHLSKALREIGHNVDVVSGPPYPELEDGVTLYRLPSLDLYNPENLFRIPTLRELKSPINLLEWLEVSSGGFPEPLTFSIRAYKFFKQRHGYYDIVHDNQCLAYGILKIKELGYPTVATIHHPITVDRQTEIKSADVWWKKLKVMRWYSFIGMQKRVSRRMSRIITVSNRSKHDISSEFNIPPGKFRVVANGVNTDIFHPLDGIKRDENHIIVTNSADTPLKGLKYLLEAIASIRRKRQDIKLTVIGKPKKGGVIEKLVRELGISSHVHFTGRIRDEEFSHYYAMATMAVVPSLYEGFGLPAGEAMACKVPVISTMGGALPEVVGDAGILVPPGNARELEKAILYLLDHPQERSRLAEKGYARVMNHFTWTNAALKHVEVYKEAINDYG